eukprot:3012891-Prorocentrum_lima.AAC.1
MTSSLVGSEMCIRDSVNIQMTSFLLFALALEVHKYFDLCKLLPATFFSVSYTHLTLPTICSV